MQRFIVHQTKTEPYINKIKIMGQKLLRKYTAVIEFEPTDSELISGVTLKMKHFESSEYGLKAKMGLSVVHPKDLLKKKEGVKLASQKMKEVMFDIISVKMTDKKIIILINEPETDITLSYVKYKQGNVKLFLHEVGGSNDAILDWDW